MRPGITGLVERDDMTRRRRWSWITSLSRLCGGRAQPVVGSPPQQRRRGRGREPQDRARSNASRSSHRSTSPHPDGRACRADWPVGVAAGPLSRAPCRRREPRAWRRCASSLTPHRLTLSSPVRGGDLCRARGGAAMEVEPPAQAPMLLATYVGIGDTEGIVAPSPTERRPIRIGGGMRPPTKVHHVSPEYPADARNAGLSGVVILRPPSIPRAPCRTCRSCAA